MKLPDINLDWGAFAGASIVVERRHSTGKNSLGEKTWDDATPINVYTGAANVFDKQAAIMITKVGEIMAEQLAVIIDPTTSGTLPAVAVGDRVRLLNPGDGQSQHVYLVEHAHVWDMVPRSLELKCKLASAW